MNTLDLSLPGGKSIIDWKVAEVESDTEQ